MIRISLSAFAMTILLTGCVNIQFDNVEYNRLIEISVLSNDTISACGTPLAEPAVHRIHDLTKRQRAYASWRIHRADVAAASVELDKLAETIDLKYSSTEPPSRMYCVEKMKNIKMAADRMGEIMGDLEI